MESVKVKKSKSNKKSVKTVEEVNEEVKRSEEVRTDGAVQLVWNTTVTKCPDGTPLKKFTGEDSNQYVLYCCTLHDPERKWVPILPRNGVGMICNPELTQDGVAKFNPDMVTNGGPIPGFHWQIMLMYGKDKKSKGVRIQTVRDYMPYGIHVLPCRGTWLENYKYCTKIFSEKDPATGEYTKGYRTRVPGMEPVMVGDCEDRNEKRSIYCEIKAEIDSGSSLYTISRNDRFHYAWLTHYNAYKEYVGMKPPVARKKYDANTFIEKLDLSKVCVIKGPSNIGKTEWAVSHFQNPLVIRRFDGIRQLDPKVHDGLIFDEANFMYGDQILGREAQLALVEFVYETAIPGRYSDIKIPASFPRVFVSNVFPFIRNDEAFDRRINYYIRTEKLYKEVVPEPVVEIPVSSGKQEIEDEQSTGELDENYWGKDPNINDGTREASVQEDAMVAKFKSSFLPFDDDDDNGVPILKRSGAIVKHKRKFDEINENNNQFN